MYFSRTDNTRSELLNVTQQEAMYSQTVQIQRHISSVAYSLMQATAYVEMEPDMTQMMTGCNISSKILVENKYLMKYQ